jgi:hypothetical protein
VFFVEIVVDFIATQSIAKLNIVDNFSSAMNTRFLVVSCCDFLLKWVVFLLEINLQQKNIVI